MIILRRSLKDSRRTACPFRLNQGLFLFLDNKAGPNLE